MNEDLKARMKRYEDLMVEAGSRLLEIGSTLDVLARDILSLNDHRVMPVEMEIAYMDEMGKHRIARTESLRWDRDENELVLSLRRPRRSVRWSLLSASVKDMLLNAIIIGLSAELLYEDFRQH